MPTHTVALGGERFTVPIRWLGEVGIAYLDFLCDRRLVAAGAAAVTARLPDGAGAIVVPAVGAVPLGYRVAELTDRPLVVLRKQLRGYMGDVLSEQVRSVTSRGAEHLHLEQRYVATLRPAPVVLLDTVMTTGSTLRAMRSLMRRADVAVAHTAVVFVEGDADPTDVDFVARLPVFGRDEV